MPSEVDFLSFHCFLIAPGALSVSVLKRPLVRCDLPTQGLTTLGLVVGKKGERGRVVGGDGRFVEGPGEPWLDPLGVC